MDPDDHMLTPTAVLDRPLHSPVFHTPAGPRNGATFLADAHEVAAGLLPGCNVVNLCRDRYAFAVAFAATLIAHGTTWLNIGQPGQAALPPGCLVLSDTAIPGATLVRPRANAAPAPVANPLIASDHVAAIVYTSGSTGEPVAHRKTWGVLVNRSRAAAEQFGLAGDTIIGCVPPHHMYGFETTILLPMHTPVAAWCGPAFFPADIAAALAASPAPHTLVTVPLQLRSLLQGSAQGASPTRVISATAPLDPALARDAEDTLGCSVFEIFGATECGSIASRRTTAGAEWSPYPGISIDITETGASVRAPGTPPVPLADMLEATPSGFRLLGRRTDVVKLGGRRASLPGLNQLLTGLPGIDDGAFVMPDEHQRGHARLVAVVVAPGRTAPSILADLRRVIDPVFMPRRVIQVQRLPRNDLGKLPRNALLQLVAQAG